LIYYIFRYSCISKYITSQNVSRFEIDREGFLFLKSIYIRVYLLGRHETTDKELLSSDEIASIIWNLIEAGIAS